MTSPLLLANFNPDKTLSHKISDNANFKSVYIKPMSVFLLVHLQISEQFMGINQPGLWNSPFDQSEAQKMFFPSSLLISADSGHHLRVLLFLYQPMRELYFLQLTNLRLGNSEMEQIYSLLTLRSRNVELWLSYNSLVAYYVDDSHLT